MNGKKNYMIISKDSVKEFVKIKHPFMLNKNIQQTRNEGEHPQFDNIYKKTYVNIIFNGEINTGHLLPNTENKMRISLSSFQFNIIQ